MKKTLLALAALSLFSAGSVMATTNPSFATAEAKWAGQVPMAPTASDKYAVEPIAGSDFSKNNRLDLSYDATNGAKIIGSEQLAFRLVNTEAANQGKYANKFTVKLDKFQLGINTTNGSGITIPDTKDIILNVSGNGVPEKPDFAYGKSITVDAAKNNGKGAASFAMEVGMGTATSHSLLGKDAVKGGDMVNIIAAVTISDISGTVELGATTTP